MKVKALANLSTAQGRKTVGQEFTVNGTEAEELIARRLVRPVADVEAPVKEKAKPKSATRKS